MMSTANSKKQKNVLSKQKTLGQYFTPKHIVEFTLSGLKKKPNSILDPMAGNGSFLKECYLKFPSANITGVQLGWINGGLLLS